jgi:hypothetical protein
MQSSAAVKILMQQEAVRYVAALHVCTSCSLTCGEAAAWSVSVNPAAQPASLPEASCIQLLQHRSEAALA